MTTTQPKTDEQKRRANLKVAGACTAFFAGMVGVAFAAVPLYELFCQVTGYGGTTQRVEQYSSTILDREITVRFDSNVRGGLPWEFSPNQRSVRLRIGETTQVSYSARNAASTRSTGTATFNVVPEQAGAYFMKMECFCFTETTLEPGEDMDMPVVFYVDPAIVEIGDIGSITLSYTFFPTVEGSRPLAARGTDTEIVPAAEAEIGG
jgi:cytochrome c oxidase assembly protein subunit 11